MKTRTTPGYQLVAGAVIIENRKIFLTQRRATQSFPYKWHIPGGKYEEADMTTAHCLRREIKEELNVDCSVGDVLSRVRVKFEDIGKAYEIVFHRVRLLEQVCLVDLVDCRDARWVTRMQMGLLDLIPIDRAVANLALEEAELS